MITMTKKLQGLMDELKNTNAETFYHSVHVKFLVNRMILLMNAVGITSYTPDELDYICKGALLHDIGKLYVKNSILTKMSSLNEEEKEAITKHTSLGFEAICNELTEDEYEFIKNICLYHHERIDGSGYQNMRDLPLYVQIVSICDVFDALNSDRIYRDKIPYNETIAMIEDGQSGYFSSDIIEFLKKVTKGLEE